MANDKSCLTYNQQMKKLRKDKKIDCNGTPHKISLVRSGYFNRDYEEKSVNKILL